MHEFIYKYIYHTYYMYIHMHSHMHTYTCIHARTKYTFINARRDDLEHAEAIDAFDAQVHV